MFLCLINHYPKKTSLNWESLHGFTYWTCSLNMPWISPLLKHTYISMHVFECQLGLNFTTAWIHAACLLPAISVQWVSFVSVHLYAVCVCGDETLLLHPFSLARAQNSERRKKWRGIGMNSISLAWKLPAGLSWNRERASSEERRVLMWSSAKGNEEMEQGCSGEVARKEVCLYEGV